MIAQSVVQKPCPGCGALYPDIEGPIHAYIGSSAGCWAVIGEVLAREYSDPIYFSVHRLTVDTYAAQHPGLPSRRSIQSVAVHLISLYLVLERGYDFERATEVMRKALRQRNEFKWLEPPADLGALTVLDVAKAKDFAEHTEVVKRWASSVWLAWSPYHTKIQEWI